jgi:putative DNA primase/helicase
MDIMGLEEKGGMSATVSAETFGKQKERAWELTKLERARFVVTDEPDAGRFSMDAGRMKSFTGNKWVSAEDKGKKHVSFVIIAKIWYMTNHLPEITDDSQATWERLIPVPFLRTFRKDEQDKNLAATLTGELPGILAWLVRGAVRWYQEGLGDRPASIQALAERYQREMDPYGAFMEAEVRKHPTARVRPQRLFERYREWMKKNSDDKPGSVQKFGRDMSKRLKIVEDYTDEDGNKTKDKRKYYIGICLRGDNVADTIKATNERTRRRLANDSPFAHLADEGDDD